MLDSDLYLRGLATSNAGAGKRGGAPADVGAVDRAGRQVGSAELLTPDGVRKRPADETSLGLVAGVVDLEGPRIVRCVLRAQHSTRCARRD